MQCLQVFTRYKRAQQDETRVLAQRNSPLPALFPREKSEAVAAAGGGCADPSSPAPEEAARRPGTSAQGGSSDIPHQWELSDHFPAPRALPACAHPRHCSPELTFIPGAAIPGAPWQREQTETPTPRLKSIGHTFF